MYIVWFQAVKFTRGSVWLSIDSVVEYENTCHDLFILLPGGIILKTVNDFQQNRSLRLPVPACETVGRMIILLIQDIVDF